MATNKKVKKKASASVRIEEKVPAKKKTLLKTTPKKAVLVEKQKTHANIGFEKEIWDAACVLWGHIPAAEYRHSQRCMFTNRCQGTI